MLLKQADVFGLTIFGDGATITTSPLTNLMASGVHEPAALLDVVDSTGHMAQGGMKDARYLSQKFLLEMIKLDPNKRFIDLVTFDGAKNVQNAGEIMVKAYPRATVTHGAEHACSLFFTDIFKHPVLKLCISFAKKLRNIFGSVRHAPASIFKKNSSEFNNGILLKFTKPSECRMAGEVISLLRLYRLKDALKATVTCKPFVETGQFTDVSVIILGESFWDFIFKFCRSVYAMMRIIRLADMKKPAMDKLMYYVLQGDEMLNKYLPEATKAWEEFFPSAATEAAMTFNETEEIKSDSESDTDDSDDENSGEKRSEHTELENSDADEDEGEVDTDMDLDEFIKDCWKKRREALLHDYARVGFMLSPNPKIMERVQKETEYMEENREACERLVKKLFVNGNLTESERSEVSITVNALFSIFI